MSETFTRCNELHYSFATADVNILTALIVGTCHFVAHCGTLSIGHCWRRLSLRIGFFFPLENLDDLFVADTYIAFNVLAQNPAPFPARLAKYKRVEDMPSRSLDVSTFPPN